MITTANSEAEETPQGSLERQTEEAPKKPAKLKSSTFTNGQTVQYRVGTTVLNTAVTWTGTIENNVNALMTAINNNTTATDVAARLWHSNNASGTFYLQLYYTQPGNWKGQSLNVYVNGATNNASVKRAMGYGTSKGSDVVGAKRYELSNHLGNVLSVITDRKWAVDDGIFNTTTGIKTSSTFDGLADYYVATIVSYSDYDPFGTMQDGRKGSQNGEKYRFGMNGQEKDDEISGEGNSYSAEFWQYSPRIGRRWNQDPVVKFHESPYACFANNPIWLHDPNGADTLDGVKVDKDVQVLQSAADEIKKSEDKIVKMKENRANILKQLDEIENMQDWSETMNKINPVKKNPVSKGVDKLSEMNAKMIKALKVAIITMELDIQLEIEAHNKLVKDYNKQLQSLKIDLEFMDSDDTFAVTKPGVGTKHWKQNTTDKRAIYRINLDGKAYRFGFANEETKSIIRTVNTFNIQKQISISWDILGISLEEILKETDGYEKIDKATHDVVKKALKKWLL